MKRTLTTSVPIYVGFLQISCGTRPSRWLICAYYAYLYVPLCRCLWVIGTNMLGGWGCSGEAFNWHPDTCGFEHKQVTNKCCVHLGLRKYVDISATHFVERARALCGLKYIHVPRTTLEVNNMGTTSWYFSTLLSALFPSFPLVSSPQYRTPLLTPFLLLLFIYSHQPMNFSANRAHRCCMFDLLLRTCLCVWLARAWGDKRTNKSGDGSVFDSAFVFRCVWEIAQTGCKTVCHSASGDDCALVITVARRLQRRGFAAQGCGERRGEACANGGAQAAACGGTAYVRRYG